MLWRTASRSISAPQRPGDQGYARIFLFFGMILSAAFFFTAGLPLQLIALYIGRVFGGSGRDPKPAESARLKQLVEVASEHFAAHKDQAMKMATEPIGQLPKGADVAEIAAWTVVGNVLLNLDEIYMKR